MLNCTGVKTPRRLRDSLNIEKKNLKLKKTSPKPQSWSNQTIIMIQPSSRKSKKPNKTKET